jgi:hypothetical protein
MSINSSVQQISGGIASIIAGLIVIQTSSGKLSHYNTIGYIVSASIIVTIIMLRSINRSVNQKAQLQGIPQPVMTVTIKESAEVHV